LLRRWSPGPDAANAPAGSPDFPSIARSARSLRVSGRYCSDRVYRSASVRRLLWESAPRVSASLCAAVVAWSGVVLAQQPAQTQPSASTQQSAQAQPSGAGQQPGSVAAPPAAPKPPPFPNRANELMPSWLRVRGEFRERVERSDNAGFADGRDDTFLLSRVRLTAVATARNI